MNKSSVIKSSRHYLYNYNRRVYKVNPQNKASIHTVYGNEYANDGNRYRSKIEFHLFFINVELILRHDNHPRNAPSTPEFYITINADNTNADEERNGGFQNIYDIEHLLLLFKNITKNKREIPDDVFMRIIGFFLHP
jgi:hypothetical protein